MEVMTVAHMGNARAGAEVRKKLELIVEKQTIEETITTTSNITGHLEYEFLGIILRKSIYLQDLRLKS